MGWHGLSDRDPRHCEQDQESAFPSAGPTAPFVQDDRRLKREEVRLDGGRRTTQLMRDSLGRVTLHSKR